MKKIILFLLLSSLSYANEGVFVYTESSYKGNLDIFSNDNIYQYSMSEVKIEFLGENVENPESFAKFGFSAKKIIFPYIFSIYSYTDGVPKHYANIILNGDKLITTKRGIISQKDGLPLLNLSLYRGVDAYKHGIVKLGSPYFPDAFAYSLCQQYKDMNPIVVYGSSKIIVDKIIINMSKGDGAKLPLSIISDPAREYSFNYNYVIDKTARSSQEIDKRYSKHLIDFSVPFVFTIYFGGGFDRTPLFPAVNIFFLENVIKFVYSPNISDSGESCKRDESEIKRSLENYNGIMVPSYKVEHQKLIVSIDRDYFAYAFADYLYYESSCYNKGNVVFGSIN